MIELVADVERYPDFVPLCTEMAVLSRERRGHGEAISARMTVAYAFLKERFTSQVTVDRDSFLIEVESGERPFRHLRNIWSFVDRDEGGCEIGFSIEYELRSRALALLSGAVIDRALRRFVTAFEERADTIYGG